MSAMPDLGLRFHSGMNVHRCIELAQAAEKAGLRSIWFAENPYERGVLPAASGCAVTTERLRIGIGVFNPYNRHPSLMAMEMGALDELSNGRAILGIGSGVPGWIAKIMPHEKPLAAMRDATRIASDLLRGDEVDYDGSMYSAHKLRLGFRLMRERVPVYLAAMAPRALQMCGELSDGLIIGNMCPPAYTQYALELMRQGAETAGRTPPNTIVKYVPCCINADRRVARDTVKAQIGAMLTSYIAAYQTLPAVRASITNGNGIAPERFDQALQRLSAGEPATTVLDDSFAEAYAVAGTADDCLRQCAELGQGGCTEVVLSFLGEAPETQMAQIAAELRH